MNDKKEHPARICESHAKKWRNQGKPGCASDMIQVAEYIKKLEKAVDALLPHLPTEADLLDRASLNEGRASEFDMVSVHIRRVRDGAK